MLLFSNFELVNVVNLSKMLVLSTFLKCKFSWFCQISWFCQFCQYFQNVKCPAVPRQSGRGHTLLLNVNIEVLTSTYWPLQIALSNIFLINNSKNMYFTYCGKICLFSANVKTWKACRVLNIILPPYANYINLVFSKILSLQITCSHFWS